MPKKQEEEGLQPSFFTRVINLIRSLFSWGEQSLEDMAELVEGNHRWYAMNHTRPIYCNVCREALSGMKSYGLSCEICKYKVHKKCAVEITSDCKWTTLASIGNNIIEDRDGCVQMRHQWIEGNLPVSSKCFVCNRTCGSVLRLQDWRCLWCKITVHATCRHGVSRICSLGPYKFSIVPPTALYSTGTDEVPETVKLTGCSPLLVFVNSKSGDNQGVKFLRKFKQLLNPAQIFDLITDGPCSGLRLFRRFDLLRVVVGGGDGSVSWVLSEIDRLGMHNQCQVGVLPLGTGNDLSRVLGWGPFCDDIHLPHLLEKYETAGTKMLDRWSVIIYEHKKSCSLVDPILNSNIFHEYEKRIFAQITNILESHQQSADFLPDVKILCTTLTELINHILAVKRKDCLQIRKDCEFLFEKLDYLLDELSTDQRKKRSDNTDDDDIDSLKINIVRDESTLNKPEKDITNLKKVGFTEKELLMSRVNSFKKTVSKLVGYMENVIEYNNFVENHVPLISIPDDILLSPIPERRDWQPEFLTLPTLDGFADSRRNSENIESYDVPAVQIGSGQQVQAAINDNYLSPGPLKKEAFFYVHKTYLDISTSLDDIVKKDTIILDSRDAQPFATVTQETNSINSRPSESSELGSCAAQASTLSEVNSSELGSMQSVKISRDNFDGENQLMDSGSEDLNSLGQDVISATVGEMYNSIREDIESHRYHGLDQLSKKDKIEKDFKKSTQSIKMDNEMNVEPGTSFGIIDDDIQTKPLTPHINILPPALTMNSHRLPNKQYNNSNYRKRLIGELPELGFSPLATRRLSSGSLKDVSIAIAHRDNSGVNLHHEEMKENKTDYIKKFPIINPLVESPMWSNTNISGGSGVIRQALLANANALCAPVSSFMNLKEIWIEGFEKQVMNNYLGIGIDAKIALDFHNKREEHPEKCRSRIKNKMWYGILGSKEMLLKTCKNLDQRIILECDGQMIPLPSLQGIVILNIPSFMGGTNFWGGIRQGNIFVAPSFDDGILEVVAVFGSVQMAASRIVNLQHHRIAQCQTVRITILGQEGIPVEIDGEAWVQSPSTIQIQHKNRMKMLYRSKELETSLKTWQEKQRVILNVQFFSNDNASQRAELPIHYKPLVLTNEELDILFNFIESVMTLVKWIKLLIISNPSLESDLYHLALRTENALEKVHPDGKILQGVSLRPMVTGLVGNARQLYEDSYILHDRTNNLILRDDLESKLSPSLDNMEQELQKCIFDTEDTELVYLENIQEDEKNRHRELKFRRSDGNSDSAIHHPVRDMVITWDIPEVCAWLKSLQLEVYSQKFLYHEIRGRELLTLARRDLKELGINKVGHIKRILQAINELSNN